MPEPVPLKVVKVRAAPEAGLIKMLESLLAMAKEGKLQGLACACVYANDLEPGGDVGEGWSAANFTNYAMTHAIARLQTKWMRHTLDRTGD